MLIPTSCRAVLPRSWRAAKKARPQARLTNSPSLASEIRCARPEGADARRVACSRARCCG